MSIKTNQINIPKLRFPNFINKWMEKKFEEVFFRITQKNTVNNLNVLTISAQQGLINQEKFFTKSVSSKNLSGYFLLNKDDFAYNKSYSKGYPMGALKRLTKYDSGVVSPLYICFKIKDNNNLAGFFEKYFDAGKINNEINKIAQEGARNHGLLNMSVSDFFSDINLTIPSFPEQQKIASFLSKVDEWIENLKEQKENLGKYKKGMMQKIFAQEIRFKDENGKKFPEWEEKRLGEIGNIYNGLTGKSAEDFGVGKAFITYKQIFDSSFININRFSFVKISSSENQNKGQFGDIFFTTSSETPEEVGFASVLLEKNIFPYLNSFSFGFRPNSLLKLDPYFAKFFFRHSIYRREVIKLAQGSTRYNISKSGFIKIKIKLPLLEEQQKISDFLESIDKLLESKQQQIVKAEEWKKGLMQGLFV